MSDSETVATPRGDLPFAFARPAGEGPWPGVVVIHDFIGMSNDLHRQTDWLASKGFLTAAPDLFRGGTRIRFMRRLVGDAIAGRGPTFDDLEAVRSWLVGRPDCTGRIGIIGFCMGGGFALLLAPSRRYDAASVNYGTTTKKALTDAFLAGSCPIVGSYAGKDPVNRGTAARLASVLTRLDVPHDVKEYPDVNHGFINDHDREDVPWLIRLEEWVTGPVHDVPAAEDAKQRIIAFFEEHLRVND